MTLLHLLHIYPRMMTEVNVSTTVGEMSATVGGGNVHNSGEIEYGVGNLKVEIVIHNSAWITSEDAWNNM